MSDETIKQANNALKEFGEKFAEMVLFTQELFKKMTPEQRAVVDFLAENPKVAEAFQELNQKLARQKVIEGATKEAAQPEEPLIKDEKIRKAVRAWAEADDLDNFRVQNQHFNECKIIGYTAGINKASFIGFQTTIAHADNKKLYTIAELCGEEEE